MIESCEQTGHRRMITSAAASAQSAFGLLCAAESEIKTIVQTGLCPGYSDRHRILPGAEPSPLSEIRLEKNIKLPLRQLLPLVKHRALAGQRSQYFLSNVHASLVNSVIASTVEHLPERRRILRLLVL